MILSGSATSAGISHASLTLKTVGMADLLDGVKSDANRTFDYLNGALGIGVVGDMLAHMIGVILGLTEQICHMVVVHPIVDHVAVAPRPD